MGFLAPAAPFVPMLLGAGVGAIADKDNPLRGAMLGAVGGSVLGPSMAGLTGAGAAASEAAVASGMGAEAAKAAAQYGAAGGAAGAGFSPMQAAMLAEQTAPFGATGIAHTLGSAGVSTPMAKLAALGVSGPQGILSQMSPKDMMMKSGRMILGQMNQPQPMPQQAPPPAAGAAAPRPTPAFQPVRPFVTGMPNMRKREDPYNIWGGGY